MLRLFDAFTEAISDDGLFFISLLLMKYEALGFVFGLYCFLSLG